jgi:hypothetical protein
MARNSREIWKARVREWADSGLTARAFATKTGVNVHTLTHWKWRLGVEGDGDVPRPAPRRAAFVEVVAPRVHGGDRRVERPAEGEPIELVLSSGLRIRIPDQFEVAALRRILDAVEGH